ncbi:MAG TPA: TonB-dependent receptor [Caulobacteraceae bacterium]|nr:TonB-dependent receptor [Caulobacteraceae bacterium]
MAHAQGGAATGSRDVEVEEVVVTAQRRSERAIDVPQTVSVVTGDTIEQSGITTTQDLGQVVPGLQIAAQGDKYQPTIRGVGSSVTNVGTTGTVGIYVDGIYQVSQTATMFQLNNVDNIQVLKGPQGTLYGRNSTGGAILVTTKTPTHDPEANISLSYGNYNALAGSFYGSAGLTESIAANLAISYSSSDSWFYDIGRNVEMPGNDALDVRTKIKLDLSDTSDLVMILSHSDSSDGSTQYAAPLNGRTASRDTNPNVIYPTEPYDVALTFSPFQDRQVSSASLIGTFRFPTMTFTSQTSYHHSVSEFASDPDFSPPPTTDIFRHDIESAASQEILVSSEGDGRLRWIAGGSLVYESGEIDPQLGAGIVRQTKMTTTAGSAFAELTYALTERLQLVGGARYTHEAKDYVGVRNGLTVVSDEADWGEWTPRVSVRYNLTEDTNIYATFSRGFRSGGWNQAQLSDVGYNPEYVDAYEIGAKSTPFYGLNVDFAAYSYQYSDIQFQASTSTVGGGSLTTIVNAAQASIKGAELAVQYRPFRGLLLNTGLSYTKGTYDEFPNAIQTTPNGIGRNTQFVGDASGNTMIRTPEFTASVGGAYTFEAPMGDIEVSGNAFHSSSYFTDVANRLEQPAYTVINGKLSWAPGNANYEIALWGKNLADERYASYIVDSSLGDRVTWAAPRTYGVSLEVSF